MIIWTGSFLWKVPSRRVAATLNLFANGVSMRTISAIALCLMLVFATTGCAASKIAVVDISGVIIFFVYFNTRLISISTLEAAMQEQLKTAQGMIEKAPNDEALRARFQKTFVGYQQIVNAEQQKVVQQINGLMQKTLEDFRTKNGYSVIMNAEGLLAFDPKSDVTKDVIAEMDKTKVTFAPVKLEPITAAPKADDKAAPKADAKPEAKK